MQSIVLDIIYFRKSRHLLSSERIQVICAKMLIFVPMHAYQSPQCLSTQKNITALMRVVQTGMRKCKENLVGFNDAVGIVGNNLGSNLLSRPCSLSKLFMQIGYELQFPTDLRKSHEADLISLYSFILNTLISFHLQHA